MTEGVGYARDLWSEAPTLFDKRILSNRAICLARIGRGTPPLHAIQITFTLAVVTRLTNGK